MKTALPGPPPERMIVYVDGFNLYNGLHAASGRSMLWLDLVALASSLRPTQQLVKVKYFTAPVLDDPGAQSRQAHYIAALEAKHPHRIDVIQGRYQQKQVWCSTCGNKYTTYEEKETDVNIAVSLVSDAAMQAMTTALLISGDSDLAPAVRAARRLRPSLFSVAAFPPKRKSKELQRLMPASFVLGSGRIKAAQLPDSFTEGTSTFQRPVHWR
ncbi:NYN domain-containing protein [Agrococcus sp. KRD186]|uniref:NYN domain-containing protein n=1 Tax=Agrococcus sp. KRD186 TaxID=2729730 RepID=UPI0019D26264|nr:NYN domain-containing protein [Agrococcus sp. KRD186]